jgi:hypothetical protein
MQFLSYQIPVNGVWKSISLYLSGWQMDETALALGN